MDKLPNLALLACPHCKSLVLTTRRGFCSDECMNSFHFINATANISIKNLICECGHNIQRHHAYYDPGDEDKHCQLCSCDLTLFQVIDQFIDNSCAKDVIMDELRK